MSDLYKWEQRLKRGGESALLPQDVSGRPERIPSVPENGTCIQCGGPAKVHPYPESAPWILVLCNGALVKLDLKK
jgi:hypothetical protein